jgi:hypothetical protein
VIAYYAVRKKRSAEKIGNVRFNGGLAETRSQLLFEWKHLQRKVRAREPKIYRQHCKILIAEQHPLFRIVGGGVPDWEKNRSAQPSSAKR